MSNDTEKSFDVTIFTHESADLPFEQTVVDLLTHFFVGIRAPLQTYILADNLANFTPQMTSLGNYLPLVDEDNYKKVCVSSTQQFVGKKSNVIFISCHGFNHSNGEPTGLSFHCENNTKIPESYDQFVWANVQGHYAPALYDVIKHCELAIVLTCCGNQLIKDYKSNYLKNQNYLHFPDILICNNPTIHSHTVEIFTVLFVNIMDSAVVTNKPLPQVVYDTARKAIIRIFQIVRLFCGDPDDPKGFWDFLQSVGCITNSFEAKEIEQLTYPRKRLGDSVTRYRIAGSLYSWLIREHVQNEIFSEFKALQLFYKDESIRVEDWNSVSDIQLETQPPIDFFLYAYQQGKTKTQSHLSLLLEKLQELH
jgi:hypothetical protein